MAKMLKLSIFLFVLYEGQSFVVKKAPVIFARKSQHGSTSSSILDMDVQMAKKTLMDTSRSLRKEYGIFLIERQAKDSLKAAVESLEKCSSPPTPATFTDQFLGDWTLICTTATSVDGLDTSKLPSFFNDGPLKSIRDSITQAANKYLAVEQRVRSTNSDGVVDRIDHVLEYRPPDELRQILDNLPEQLTTLNINPLHVSKSRLTLIHKATVEALSPLPRTKISLTSIVLNVAGTSTFLDPSGRDIAGINLPLGEFLNTGDFETTFMDDYLRISRGKRGFVDQLRVFIRTDKIMQEEALRDILGTGVGRGVSSNLDVDETTDPAFSDSQPEAEATDDVGTDDLSPSA